MFDEHAQPATNLTPAVNAAPQPLFGLSRRGWLGVVASVLVAALLLTILTVRLQQAGRVAATAPKYPLEGRTAPDITAPLLNGAPGQMFHLTALKGKPVVVNFWASWCDPCTEEMPRLQTAYQTYQRQGVEFLGIAIFDSSDNARPFLQKYGVTYPAVLDSAGATTVDYGIASPPFTVFIGRDGKVVSKVAGGVSKEQLDSNIQALLA